MASLRYRETNLLPAEQMLAVLAKVATDLPAGLAALAGGGLRVIRHMDGRDSRQAYLLIPDMEPAAALIAELGLAGCAVDPPAPLGTPEPCPDFAAGVAALVQATAAAADGVPAEPAEPLQDDAMVVVAARHEQLPELARALMASAPASRVDGFRGDGEEYLVCRVADNPGLASALGAFAAGPWGHAGRYFECFSAGNALLCFPRDMRPAKAALRACAPIFAAVLKNNGDRGCAFAVDAPDGDVVPVLSFEPPRRTPAALDGRKPSLRVIERPLVNDGKVIERLRRSIAARGDGYAVRLDRLPLAGRTRSPESIRNEIARLEAEWQIAVGLQAPQVKLLRFDHSQVQAMVDALRRLPIADIGRVQYAFSASADSPSGYHYLKYSTRDVQPLQPFIECMWRTACGGGPIVHWIDPAWARIYQRGKVRSLVMVPEDHVFSPAFYAFRPEDMDRHLWETIDAWSGAARRDGARQMPQEPIYVFTPADAPPSGGQRPAGRVQVEILDGARFTAITEQIGFINDYLLVADRIDIADLVRSAAREARRCDVLDALSEDAAARAQELNDLASDLERTLQALLGDYLALLTREVELLGRSIAAHGVQVERLTQESEVIMQHVADACGERAALRFTVHGVPDDFAPVAEERAAIESGLARVIAATSDTIETSNTRLQDARRRLAALESKLRRAR